MNWIITNIYGAWCAENEFGYTVWALSKNQLITCIDKISARA